MITINNTKLKLLGDTHLGRRYVSNVPLHRRGDREKMIWDQFVRDLVPEGADIHVHMGDLFDKPAVDLTTIFKTAIQYVRVATANPKTEFVILRGNHDAARDLQINTAFDIFTRIVDHTPNVAVVNDWAQRDGFVFCGWDPILPAKDMVEKSLSEGVHTIFGHWDVDLRSDPFNLIPTETLSVRGIQRAFTGHVHLPDQFSRDGVDVTVVGSMQPFAWGEQANDDIYVEVSLDQIDSLDLTNKVVKVRLQPGEVFDRQIDCLQLTIVKATADQEEAELDVSLGDFSLAKLFDETLAEFTLPPAVQEGLRQKWSTTFASQG